MAKNKILKLVASNFKRLKVVEISSDGKDVVVISGNNAQGKSSCLDAIEAVLRGKNFVPQKPVRDGEKKANVAVVVGEDGNPKYTFKRSFNAESGTTTLTIEDAKGVRQASPQAFADKLLSGISFDPLAFSRLDRAGQVKQLKDISGIGEELDKLDSEIKETYNLRTVANRVADMTVKRHSALTAPVDPAGFVHPLSNEDKAQLTEAEGLITERSKRVEAKDRADSQLLWIKQRKEVLKLELAKLEAEEASMLSVVTGTQKWLGEYEWSTIEGFIKEKNEQQKAFNEDAAARVDYTRALNEYNRSKEEVDKTQKEAAALDAQLESVRERKENVLRAAKFPIEGLSFSEDGVMYKGVPYEQRSTAEQIKIGVAIAAALHPELPVILIRDGSLLDDASFAQLSEFAKEKELQIWMEAVGEDDRATVVIEDGGVKQ